MLLKPAFGEGIGCQEVPQRFSKPTKSRNIAFGIEKRRFSKGYVSRTSRNVGFRKAIFLDFVRNYNNFSQFLHQILPTLRVRACRTFFKSSNPQIFKLSFIPFFLSSFLLFFLFPDLLPPGGRFTSPLTPPLLATSSRI